MAHYLKTTAAIAALTMALAGCASAPEPSSRLLTAEQSLMAARADPATVQMGRTSLEKAGVALADAREHYMDRDEDDYIHAIRMGEGYVALAKARGGQMKAEAEIAALNAERAEIVSETRKLEVARAEAATLDAQSETASAEARADQSDASAATSRALTAQAQAREKALREELADYELKQSALGMTMILQDLQFATNSAVLTAGAQGRLAPLANFLRKQPEARIQVVGHTDAQGNDAFNQDLSQRRAASVGAYLVTTGIDASRIEAIGKGESSPVASNDTVAGRTANRRVEVTILD